MIKLERIFWLGLSIGALASLIHPHNIHEWILVALVILGTSSAARIKDSDSK